jgi:rare lipoprotein A
MTKRHWRVLLGALALNAGCSTTPPSDFLPGVDGPPDTHVDVSAIPDATPRAEPLSRYGNPAFYEINGQRYYTMRSNEGYSERGIASWYGKKFHGRRTSSGEIYDMFAMTAAHKTLPLPTYVEVTNLSNGRSVVVRVNDRGPFHQNRIIDLSYAAARKLGVVGGGTAPVEVRAINPSGNASAVQVKQQAREPLPTAMPDSAPAAPPQAVAMYIQLGAFSSRVNAEQIQTNLADSFPLLHISPSVSNDQTLYRVRIGPLPTVEAVDQLSARLVESGIRDAHVVID